MSENASTGAFPGDLLSSLAANPDLLKNAMQMASALASSGMLGGLLGGAPSGNASAAPSMSPPFGSGPPSQPNPPSGGIADLLAGLMGQSGSPSPMTSEPQRNTSSADSSAEKKQNNEVAEGSGQERKRPPAPSHNDRIHLLQSICPFLSEEKREKVQFLIKLLSLLSAAEQMGIGSGKLF